MGKWLNGALKVRRAMDEAGNTLTDEQAAGMAALFMPWKVGAEYKTGDRVRHGDKLYKALTDHTATEGYTPDITNYQWVEITDPAIEWPDWVQPLGYADAYALGAKVAHNGKHWVSTVEGNTWEPGVYGWEEQA